jgi:hypothetical protein
MKKDKQNVRIRTLQKQFVTCFKTGISQRMTAAFFISNIKVLQVRRPLK